MAPVKRLTDAQLDKQIRAARKRTRALEAAEPRAKSARISAGPVLQIGLTNGASIGIPVGLIPELNGIPRAELNEVEIDPLGEGLLWETSGVGLDVLGIVERMFRTALGSVAGRHLGRRTSSAKSAAARRNGRKGGRPRSK